MSAEFVALLVTLALTALMALYVVRQTRFAPAYTADATNGTGMVLQLQRLQKENEDLRAEVERLRFLVDGVLRKNHELQRELDALKTAMTVANKQNDELRDEIADWRNNIRK